jgi:tRNA G18 (ribose-2'-O)-methylase SpoU
LGSTDSVAWKHFEKTNEALEYLKKEGYILIAVEQVEGSIFLQNIENHILINKKYALIFGNEVEGVSDEAIEKSDFIVEIPQYGTKHSLNIAVSIGIVSWEFVRILRSKI